LRLTTTFFYVLIFCCAAIILGLYSYFLATTASHDVRGPNWVRAVEGISGAAVLYTIFAIFLTCFLGGKPFFAFLGIALDVLFGGAFVAIAILTRHGVGSCKGNVRTPLGNGDAASHRGWGGAVFTPSLRTVCRMNKVCFAVAIIGAFLFFLAAAFQIFLARHHQKEKKFGPSPKNNYTKGSAAGRFKFFKRKPKHSERDVHNAAVKEAEAGVIGHNGVGGSHHSAAYDTGVVGSEPYPSKYETPATAHHGVPVAGGYHGGPAGTAVNPYGYESKPAATHY